MKNYRLERIGTWLVTLGILVPAVAISLITALMTGSFERRFFGLSMTAAIVIAVLVAGAGACCRARGGGHPWTTPLTPWKWNWLNLGMVREVPPTEDWSRSDSVMQINPSDPVSSPTSRLNYFRLRLPENPNRIPLPLLVGRVTFDPVARIGVAVAAPPIIILIVAWIGAGMPTGGRVIFLGILALAVFGGIFIYGFFRISNTLRYAVRVDARVLRIIDVQLTGLAIVEFSYFVDDLSYKARKFMRRPDADAAQPGGVLEVIVDPRRPERAYYDFELARFIQPAKRH